MDPLHRPLSNLPMMEIVIALIIGFAAGYGVREWISRRRRQAVRERHALDVEYQ